MVWTKQQLGIALGLAVLALMAGGAIGFILGSRYQAPAAKGPKRPDVAQQESIASPSDSDTDDDETPVGSVASNGRHAGTRFLAAKRDFADAEAQKKEVPVAVNSVTNTSTNATVAAAETGAPTSRRRGARRAP